MILMDDRRNQRQNLSVRIFPLAMWTLMLSLSRVAREPNKLFVCDLKTTSPAFMKTDFVRQMRLCALHTRLTGNDDAI